MIMDSKDLGVMIQNLLSREKTQDTQANKQNLNKYKYGFSLYASRHDEENNHNDDLALSGPCTRGNTQINKKIQRYATNMVQSWGGSTLRKDRRKLTYQ